MADKTEFIPAGELPELEAENVDVLAVDPATGALGRKSGASLGGTAGYDVIFGLVNDYASSTTSIPIITASLEAGSYAAVAAKVLTGPVFAMLKTTDISSSGIETLEGPSTTCNVFVGGDYISFTFGSESILLFSDDSVESS